VAAETNVGARLLLLGKDGTLAGIREITAATAKLNATIADGAKASKTASAGYAEQSAGLEALQLKMATYEAQLGAVNMETDALAKVGKVAFFTLAAAGAAWTYESIKWAQNYQTALVQLRTQAGLTVTAMNAIGSAAMRNAANLGISPTAYVQAAYYPASTGFSAAQTNSITTYGAKLGAIGGADVTDTVRALTGVTKSYGFNNSQTGHTAALLNAIVGAGAMHYSDLNAALSSGLASTAHTFGVSLTSAGGALARLTDLGTPGAQAGTRLRMALALLGGPSKQSDKLLTAAGLDTTQQTAAQGAMASALVSAGLTTTQLSGALRNNSGAGGIYNALELLHSHLQGLSPEAQSALLSRAFGGGRMGTSIMQLYGNLPALSAKSTQIDKNATNKKFMQDWSATTATLDFQLKRLGDTFETLGTKFGTAVLPTVTKGIKLFTDFLNVIAKNRGLVIGLGGVITAVLVPAIGVYLYRALLSSGGAIRSVLSAYARLFGAQSAEDVALGRTDAALATNDAAYAANARAAAAADGGASGAGGLKGLTMGAGSKVGLGALTASIVAPLLNQYAGPQLKKALGTSGKTVGMDALSGAMMGMYFGPEGAALGAALGAAYGDRKNLPGQVKNLASGLHSGFDYDRHQVAHVASSLWDDITGKGGGGSTTMPRGGRLNVHAHLYVDGKEIKNVTAKQVKAQAARK
jgi:TP901 family phage tail tape measure protein